MKIKVSLFAATTLALAAALATTPALAREGVDVGNQSGFSRLVPAEQLEQAAVQQYDQLKAEAAKKGVLGTDGDPQVIRLRAIAKRLIPYSIEWNQRAKSWPWEVNLLKTKELNAFCMPAGKIAFYSGILEQLQLNDDEVAMIMGHEMAHALREHARARMGKSAATRIGASLLSSVLGLGNTGDALLNMGSQLLTLKFSREDESEADLIGMELAARSGYDPRAGVTLWKKMEAANKGAPPQFMSTHPSSGTRIQDIEANLPKVMPLFQRAGKPPQRFDAPRKTGQADGQDALAYWGVASAPQSTAVHSHGTPEQAKPATQPVAQPATTTQPASTKDAGGWVRVTP
ncbi:M48 family peptidase [Aquabacterium soli]|uniref:M48 family peptidase n=1 Tax=Aquabacterium soli TaxID=2493092 RepID=A0A3R8S632_9BURK|nr:M48 family peptidase [Aquabacterium soli]